MINFQLILIVNTQSLTSYKVIIYRFGSGLSTTFAYPQAMFTYSTSEITLKSTIRYAGAGYFIIRDLTANRELILKIMES